MRITLKKNGPDGFFEETALIKGWGNDADGRPWAAVRGRLCNRKGPYGPGPSCFTFGGGWQVTDLRAFQRHNPIVYSARRILAPNNSVLSTRKAFLYIRAPSVETFDFFFDGAGCP